MAEVRPHALIVGASSGVGRALAQSLARDWAVTAVARREDRLRELASPNIYPLVGDICNLTGIGEMLQVAVAAQGTISALIYCAGQQCVKPLRATSVQDIEDLYRVNLVAPTIMASQFASRRISSDDGVFCVISSIAADRPEPGIVAYGASKAGLNALVHGIARELGPRRAVAVAPGWLDTEMTQRFPHLYGAEFRERLTKSSPAGPATIDAVVEAVRFLISPDAKHITGQVVRVDGGASL